MNERNRVNYRCNKCNYETDNNSNYHKHLRTPKHNRPDNEYWCEVCERVQGLNKREHRRHMKTHCDRQRVATHLIFLQHMLKNFKQMKDTDGIESTYSKIERNEKYYLKNRPKKGCNMRAKSIEDPDTRNGKIEHVNAMLENNKMIIQRTNVDEYCRLKYMEMLDDYGVIND